METRLSRLRIKCYSPSIETQIAAARRKQTRNCSSRAEYARDRTVGLLSIPSYTIVSLIVRKVINNQRTRRDTKKNLQFSTSSAAVS